MSESPYTPPQANIDPPPSQPHMERPKEIEIAIWLVVAGYLIGLAGVFMTWEYQMSVQSPGQFFISQAIGIAIAIWIYYKIYQGRNWARILFLVLAVLGVLALLLPFSGDVLNAVPATTKVIMIAGHLINAAVVYLLFFSPGRHWFRKRV